MKLRYKIANGFLLLLFLAIAGLAFTISRTEPCGPAAELPAGAQTMRAASARCYGGPDKIELGAVAKPVPEPDELLVKVRSAGVNPLDYHYMRGSPYIMRLSSGLGAPADPRMGVDFSGIVEATGSDVSKFAVGDAVFGVRSGAFGEYVVVREDGSVTKKPENVSFEQAAAIPVAAVTALQALRDHGRLESGETVLINGASGGVGTFAVQIAKAFGAEVAGVCSGRNVDLVQSIGADRVFDYTRENYTDSQNRYDLIVDMVGNHSPLANTRMLTPDGRYVIVGGAKGDWLAPFKQPLQAMLLSPFVDQQVGMMLASETQEDLATLAELVASGQVVPVIDRRYTLDEVAEALRYSESGRARGKIIINIE